MVEKQSNYGFWPLVIMSVLLTACSPQFQPVKPVSESVKPALNDAALVAVDGAELPLRMWVPKGKPKAVIIALHGFNDYSNAFASAGAFFKQHRIALIAYDQRGFGQSEYRGIWAGEENLTRDLAQAVTQTSKRFPTVPVYILGESMGGAVAIVALADPAFPKVKGLILSAPAVWGGEAMSPFFRGTLWLGAHTFPEMGFTGSDLKIIASNNISMLQALSADPLVIKKTRVDAVYGLVNLMGHAYRSVQNIKVPTLLLYGDHDQVIPPEAMHAAELQFNPSARAISYPDGYHMLLRDLQGEDVMGDIKNWMLHPEVSRFSGVVDALPASPNKQL